jgi:hypothetical protein
MYEFDSVSVSTYEAASLAAKLSEKSADGWEVVAIVPAGSDITAYVKRATNGATTGSEARATTEAPVTTEAAAATGAAAAEPAGWGTAPASTSGGTSWGQTSGSESGSSWGTTGTSGTSGASSGWGAGTSTGATTQTTPTQPATPSVPAGWYHDPAGRYELRYWDGSAWTEHVSRGGQQYTDPPVA